MIKTAVIMAAGLGSRFGQYTEDIPKGFIPFKGKPMIVRSIENLVSCGIEKIIIGTGYRKECFEALQKEYPQIQCVFSPKYSTTNSMYTLYNMRCDIGGLDFLLLESDLVYEKKALRSLIECPFDSAMLISPVTKFQDQYYVEMNDRHELVNCSTKKEQITPSGELVGIHKLSNEFFRICISEYEGKINDNLKLGYEYMLLDVSRRIMPMHVLKVDNLLWYEIDDCEDLAFAEANVNIH